MRGIKFSIIIIIIFINCKSIELFIIRFHVADNGVTKLSWAGQ